MMFIVVHQTSELWMRLMLHELSAAWNVCGATTSTPRSKCSGASRASKRS